MNWDQLCRLAPALRQFEADARSIARYGGWPWYEHWIGGFRDLRSVLSRRGSPAPPRLPGSPPSGPRRTQGHLPHGTGTQTAES